MGYSKEILTRKIELFREEMIRIGLETGFDSPETVQISQNLDELIVLYQELVH
ncbi:aspartyl-phosphate phosphatase Spo0E family protein [Mesobacillus boroniphilus]|uniref:Aspartyl-phosphate phosphatase Spo0E family protein n=1 Tax=Mesobacillus boroniphilus TaxID=308892 RepID=A0A944CJE1_9BACI|nr:aspartyl-phosphate phosphatase Spo0E family protein [Mesobacillus boroniphilus]MBS8264266.1 aspartyl-phosphate phosphatase Spo0E family protein [Mesobacillus boroniphilus]